MVCKVVGLTGGIGSGKSSVAELFTALGVSVVDSDEISHGLTGPHGGAMPAIVEAFGPAVRCLDGSLDRSAMRRIVFDKPEARRQLESILHPLILQDSQQALAAATGVYAIFEVPLLFENSSYLAQVDRTLVVDCEEYEQIARVTARSKLSVEAVRAIMAAQLTRAERLARADDVIENHGNLAELALQVEAKHRYYLANLAT